MKTTLNIDDTVMAALRRGAAASGRTMSELVESALRQLLRDAHAPEHARCRALLEQWRARAGAWYVTWGNCYEFLRVVTHPRVFRRPWTSQAAGEFLAALQQSPGLTRLGPTERHAAVLAEVVAEVPIIGGNRWHDAESAVLMREHGIRRSCTRDTDFARFPWVEILDPLTGEP